MAQRRLFKAGVGLAALCVLGLVGGCGPVYDSNSFNRMVSPTSESRVNVALAALARGEYGQAEQALAGTMDNGGKDPYALLALGILYQNTGRPQKAEAAYHQILLLNPPGMISTGPWGNMQLRSIREVAVENLKMMGSTDLPIPRTGLAALPAVKAGTLTAAPMTAPAALPTALPPDGIGHAADRFALLKALMEEELVTAEEWSRRRAENLGAMLPLTQRAPAVGLDRPAPETQAVADRLRALATAFESRAITARQHTAERQIILDGILPAEPEIRATPTPPPAGVLEAATAVGHLERLRAVGLISAAEFEREKDAIERAIRGAPPARPRSSTAAPKPITPPAAAGQPGAQAPVPTPAQTPAAGAVAGTAPTGLNNPAALLQTGRVPDQVVPNPPDFANPDGAPGTAGLVAVHLASFKNQELADKGWKDLSGRFPALAGLQPRVTQVTLPDKGTVFRLNAGPFADRAKAQEFCGKLAGQFCEVVFLGG